MAAISVSEDAVCADAPPFLLFRLLLLPPLLELELNGFFTMFSLIDLFINIVKSSKVIPLISWRILFLSLSINIFVSIFVKFLGALLPTFFGSFKRFARNSSFFSKLKNLEEISYPIVFEKGPFQEENKKLIKTNIIVNIIPHAVPP